MTLKRRHGFSGRCHDLKHKPKTADALIIELKDYLGRKKLRTTDRKVVQKALTYFENNGHMMTYTVSKSE
jgi:hypothetical protein